ncbi:baseplate assembly protein [Vibrio mangrovi]|uniref:Baseplate J-like protein n=1 Tax=Vibrio mangrovi TaxID=474394 RepID=A0A1Y6ITR8_9VIBR|nr:baseplate J/gp47 family protein [Vibrio mangrovi]MDW6004725.1 baseplate J/gp47 family protein [Vibrio mangrovi]SMS01016.1 Baseplate J-like protein [Vibrio mangrovi]
MSQIDLSQLPPPEIVQQLDAVSVRTRMLNRFAELQHVDPPKAGDPLYFAFSSMAEAITRARQEFQDISLENMVAFATGSNLQQLGALRPVERFEQESDEQYRRRIQMAPEGFSTAGAEGAYIFHALNADEDVLDASVDSPEEMIVNQYILSREGDGSASEQLCQTVYDYVSQTMKRPLSDKYSVYPAEIISYRIEAELELSSGPGEEQILAEARRRLEQLIKETHVLGGMVSLSAITGAIHIKEIGGAATSQPVIDVDLIEPKSRIHCNRSQAPYCREIIVRRKAD